jgi:hypothetical protein
VSEGRIIGSRYGMLFGHMIGVLVDEFGVAQVEDAFTAIIGGIHAVLSNPAADQAVQNGLAEYSDTVVKAIDKARKTDAS